MKSNKTIHTSRTIMFAELAKVMDYAIHDDNYLESLNQNVINKKTKSGIDKTTGYLKSLYSFDVNYPQFKGLKYFWNISDEDDKPILALIYAIGHDYLLAESVDIIINTNLGDKVLIESLEQNIDIFHPSRYTPKTRRSLAQNIASSWKKAGFVTGKIKNIRTQPNISYIIVAFAFFMAYLDGLRGDFIVSSIWVKSLSLSEADLRMLALESSSRDLIQYQYAGGITSISFNNLNSKLEFNVI